MKSMRLVLTIVVIVVFVASLGCGAKKDKLNDNKTLKETYESKQAALTTENTKAQKELKIAAKEIEDFKKDLDGKIADVADLEKAQTALKTEYDGAKETHTETSASLTESKEVIAAISEKIGYTGEPSGLAAEVEAKLAAAKEEGVKKLADLQVKLDDLTAQLAAKDTQSTDVDTQSTDVDTLSTDKDAQIIELNNSIAELQKEIDDTLAIIHASTPLTDTDISDAIGKIIAHLVALETELAANEEVEEPVADEEGTVVEETAVEETVIEENTDDSVTGTEPVVEEVQEEAPGTDQGSEVVDGLSGFGTF